MMKDYHKAILDRKATGKLIRDAILESDLSFEDVSVRLELASSRVIYEWMSGAKLPSLENLANLALMLSVKIEDIVALQ